VFRVQELNDAFRTKFEGSRVLITAGVSALPPILACEVLERVGTSAHFTPDNDPHGEHDFGDDWRDELSWRKANPNFGVTVKPDYLERRAAKATKVPAAQNGFRRLHLNEWTEAAETWLTAGVWEAVQASALDLADYRGRPAWLAVDLSSKRDLTALMIVIESFDARGDSLLLAFPRFWMPADGILERSERDGVDYATWRDQEWITATPGPVVDVAHVAAAIAELAEDLDVQRVVGDAYRRPELQAELEELG
jgi:phage terminase large subunit-like protein